MTFRVDSLSYPIDVSEIGVEIASMESLRLSYCRVVVRHCGMVRLCEASDL